MSNSLRFLSLFGILALATALPAAESEKTETYPDGAKKAVYSIDPAGEKHGPLKEFYPDGTRKLQAVYSHGKLNGLFQEFFENGKPRVKAQYVQGELNGRYDEFNEQAKPAKIVYYRNGVKQGVFQEFAGGRLVRDEFWLDGNLLLPKSPQMIAAGLKAIQTAPVKTVGEMPSCAARIRDAVKDAKLQAARENAVRKLMAYRFLCDVPFEGMELDTTYVAHTEAASEIMTRVNKLTHTPDNPGMPDEEYQFARKGTGSSNIFSANDLVKSVDAYMNDSDPGNIVCLGHRRWCLNPSMGKTGFGGHAKMSAMWSMDHSRKEVPDFEYVAFPPRGLLPAKVFHDNWAWSVTLNLKKYKKPNKDDVKIHIFPTRFFPQNAKLEKAAKPLELDYFNVDLGGYAIANCIIFRPAKFRVAPNTAYWVEIKGIENADGKAVDIGYLVSFIDLTG